MIAEETSLKGAKYNRVLIESKPEQDRELNHSSWNELQVEEQRELLAQGRVRFFNNENEIPFHLALL
jgi:hypothetical protein